MFLGELPCTEFNAETMAIVLLVSVIGLRHSEAAELAWADVAPEPDGTARILIRRSKTDQMGEGKWLAVNHDVASDLSRMKSLR